MAGDFDPEGFVPDNVVDSCSVSNLLASATLTDAAFRSRFTGCITATVEYECLMKPHGGKQEHIEVQRRLRELMADGRIRAHPIGLDELQEMHVLAERRRVGRGELSCIVFAKKVGISVMTDDRKGTRFARDLLGGENRAQGTPRLLGWLLYNDHLAGGSLDAVVAEHTSMGRPLGKVYRRMHEWIDHCRSMKGGGE